MDFFDISQQCAPWVSPQLLAQIVHHESKFNPYAIGINGNARLARQPANADEAVLTAKWLVSNGYNVDLGLGQINYANLEITGLSIEEAFDPCKNLKAAASILLWNYQSAVRKYQDPQTSVYAALSAYNTGSFTKGFANGYVQKVVSVKITPNKTTNQKVKP